MKKLFFIAGFIIAFQTVAQTLSPQEKQEIINQLKKELQVSMSPQK
jgi:hypothetical protein